MGAVGTVLSVNVGTPRAVPAKSGSSGIDKRPATGPVSVGVPRSGCSGIEGDAICDSANHGGPRQAVYAFSRADLDWWEKQLGRRLPDGVFGENLTTQSLDVAGARLGERWQVGGGGLLLEVTGPRVPCATFAAWMGERGWLKAFVVRARPGAYLRVIAPGMVQAGDAIRVVHRPAHDVDVGLTFRALTQEHDLLPRLLDAGQDLDPELRDLVLARRGFDVDEGPRLAPGRPPACVERRP